MSIRFKKNTVRVNLLDYNYCVLGIQGVGKTTLAYNICEKIAPDQYVIFNCGREDGIKTLNNAIYIDLPTWADFEEAIDDIHDNRNEDEQFKNLKIVVLDTIDEIFAMAEKEIIRRSKRDGMDCKSINGAYKGYGAGIQKTVELVLDTLWKLKDVGINVFYIGHIKEKTMVDPMSEMEYQVLTSNLSNRYFSAISTKMDIVGICYIDRDIIKEKTGRKDINGKVVEKSKVTNEARKICFRSDTYAAESKSRFPNIVNEIPLDADAYIKAVEDAIRSQIEGSGKTEDEIRKEQEEEAKEKAKAIAEAEKVRKAEASLQDIVNQIQTYFDENKKNVDVLKPIAATIKEMGYKNPSMISDIEDAKTILEMCK